MKRFIIFTNKDKDPSLKVTKSVCAELEKCGAEIVTEAEAADAMIVLGGDGTLLRAVHEHPRLPVLGINLGTLGFLTEFEANDRESIKKIADGDYILEERMLLEASVNGGESFPALNDIVITRGSYPGIVRLELYVDGSLADSYSADGIIACTPTGSTAYSLSAGGPIVEPDIKLIGITPICPHTMRSRSVMISHKRTVTVKALRKTGYPMQVIADGTNICDIEGGSAVTIRTAEKTVKFIRLKNYSFYDVLNKKQELR